MLASEMVKELQEGIKKHGDVELRYKDNGDDMIIGGVAFFYDGVTEKAEFAHVMTDDDLLELDASQQSEA